MDTVLLYVEQNEDVENDVSSALHYIECVIDCNQPDHMQTKLRIISNKYVNMYKTYSINIHVYFLV